MKRFISVLIVLVLVAVTSTVYLATRNEEVLQSTVEAAPETSTSKTISSAKSVAQSTELEDDLEEVIAEYSDLTVGVSVVDVDNDYNYNAGAYSTLFKGASTIKVLTATYLMHQVEAGELSLSTRIGGVSAETLMQRMLQNSDNAAWATLINYLGDDEIEVYAHSIGITSFTGGDYNTVTTADFVKLLAKLQKPELTTAADRDIILGYMQNTNNESLIPAAVQSGTTVYHKWGTLWGTLHDVAIIQKNGRTFAVVIYTNNEADDASLNPRQTAVIHRLITTVQTDLDQAQAH